MDGVAVSEVGSQMGIGPWRLCIVVARGIVGAWATAACRCRLSVAATCTTTLASTASTCVRALAAWAAAISRPSTAAIALARAAFALALGCLVGTNAVHHFGASGLGGSLHHFAARWLACTTPDGLAAHGDGLGLFAWLRAKAFNDLDGNLLLGKALDVHHEAFLVHADEADGFASGACTARAADAVNVVLGHVGNLVVHDMWQVVDIDPAGSNVGGNQGADLTALETCQCLGAGALALVAVQCHRAHAILCEELSHIVGAEFGAGEHQYLAPVVLLDDVQQHLLFLATAHGVNHLGDALHRGVAGRDLDALGVLEQRVGQLADFIAERGREKQALLVFGHQSQHLLDVMDEPHVEHAVGFVQHQNFDRGKIQETLLLQVEQTPGCGNQYIHAALDAVDLRVHAHTAKHHGRVDIQIFTVIAHRLFDLSGQFTGGCEYQRTNALAAKFALGGCALAQAMQHGQGERSRLAGAGLCPGQKVMPFKHGGDCLRLNGGRCLIALFEHSLQDGRGQIQFFKFHVVDCTRPGRGVSACRRNRGGVAEPVSGR